MKYPHIIVIVLDTLRKDYSKLFENNLKNLNFISYNNAISPASWTTPSHASIFTGTYPIIHGAHATKVNKTAMVKLKKNRNMLNKILSEFGYTTYLLSSNVYIQPFFGFDGFDFFFDAMISQETVILTKEEEKLINDLLIKNNSRPKVLKILLENRKLKLVLKLINRNIRSVEIFNKIYYLYLRLFKNWPIDKGSNQILNFLKKNLNNNYQKSPNFIFINFMEVHEPYFRGEIGRLPFSVNIKRELRKKALSEKYLAKFKKIYNIEVNYITKQINKLFELLKKKNHFNNSLIIILSDHGQLLGEHGRMKHGTFLDDELLKVPFFIKYPENFKKKISTSFNKKFVNFIKIKDFIINGIRKKMFNDSILYSETVFAESYGIHENTNPRNKEEKEKVLKLDKYKIAIYYKDYKAIFNVKEWKFNFFKSYNGSLITPEIKEKLKRKIIEFIKRGTTFEKIIFKLKI